MRDYRITEADYVNAALQEPVSHFASQGGITQHDRKDRMLSGLEFEPCFLQSATALLICLLKLRFLALGVRLLVLLALRLRLLASLFSEHHFDVVDRPRRFADLILALGAGDLDVLALGHALQSVNESAHRLGDAELSDHEAEDQAERDADGRHGHHQARCRFILLGRVRAILFDPLIKAIRDRANAGVQLGRCVSARRRRITQLLGLLGHVDCVD